VGIGGGASRQGRQLGPAEALSAYRAQIEGSGKMTIQELIHQVVAEEYFILNFVKALALALSSQCGFIAGDTGPIVSENAWWQRSALVS